MELFRKKKKDKKPSNAISKKLFDNEEDYHIFLNAYNKMKKSGKNTFIPDDKTLTEEENRVWMQVFDAVFKDKKKEEKK